jgi:hypothetical protein
MKTPRRSSRARSTARPWGWLALSSPREESFHLVVMGCIVASASPLPEGLRILGLVFLALQVLRIVLATSADSDRLAEDRVRLRRRLASKPQ